MRILHYLALGILLFSSSVSAQTLEGFTRVDSTSQIHRNFDIARMKAISFILEADPRLSEKGKRIARSTIAELNVVVPYEAKSNDSIERCGTKDFLSSLSPEVYLCPATVDALTNPTERDVLILAQRLIRWGQIRSSDFPRIACQGSEFELTVMQRTSVGIQTTRSIDEEPVSCSPELAKFRPEETPRPTQSRRLRTQEDSPSWGEVILGSVLKAGQAYVDQRSQLENAQRTRQDHMQNFGSPSLQCRADECKICRNIGGQPQFQCAPRQGMSCTAAECR